MLLYGIIYPHITTDFYPLRPFFAFGKTFPVVPVGTRCLNHLVVDIVL